MAEDILRALGNGRVGVFSAGSAPTSLHPLAVQALARAGIDISDQRAKHLATFRGMRFDYAVTLCDCTREPCPTSADAAVQLHWAIPNPCAINGPEELRREAFMRAADELMAPARALLHHIDEQQGGH